MKKILFIIGNLDSGGVAKSIVNLLTVVDTQRYEVSLLVLSNNHGPFEQYIPSDVKIIRNDVAAAVMAGVGGLRHLALHGHLLLAIGSVLRMALSLVSKSWAGILLSRLLPAVGGEYDMIVDYNGQAQLYYMVDKLRAKRKVTFFHSDYKKWPYYESADRMYFPKVDKIFTISQQCVQSLKEVFPEVADKVTLMENISSPKMIYKLAKSPLPTSPRGDEGEDRKEKGCVTLVTVGHVCYNKGIDMAIEAARLLKERGIEFTWNFIGTTDGAEEYIKQAQSLNYINFLGVQSNPYPYIKNADIVVHPSRFEGRSITLDEAKILCKPIVVTNFSTVHDQFEDEVNASICEMDGESVASAIIDLLEDEDKRNRYVSYLQEHIVDNSSEVEKLYRVVEE